MAFIPGIDVSHWQETVDWAAVKGAGKQFAYIKATEGAGVVDDRFAGNWAGAGQNGILRGAYHFFRPLEDPLQQATRFLNTARTEPHDLPPALDLEVNDGVSAQNIQKGARIWVDEVSNKTGRKVMLYTGPSFGDTFFALPGGGPPPWVKNHQVWIANYLAYQPGLLPVLPQGWQNWHFWQHSSSGRVAGISGNVDLDWFNGSLDELYGLVGLEAPEEAEVEVKPPKIKQNYITKPGDNLRKIANLFNIRLSTLVRANPQLLQPGMHLNIPSDEQPEIEAPPQQIYVVKPGDTLFGIALRFNTTIDALVQANQIANPNLIEVGQRLVIPK